MLHCHVSQFYEWLPYNGGYTADVPADGARRRSWLEDRMRAAYGPWRIAGEAKSYPPMARNTGAASNTSKRSRRRNTAPRWTRRRKRGCSRLCRRQRTAGESFGSGIGPTCAWTTERRAWWHALRYSEGRGKVPSRPSEYLRAAAPRDYLQSKTAANYFSAASSADDVTGSEASGFSPSSFGSGVPHHDGSSLLASQYRGRRLVGRRPSAGRGRGQPRPRRLGRRRLSAPSHSIQPSRLARRDGGAVHHRKSWGDRLYFFGCLARAGVAVVSAPRLAEFDLAFIRLAAVDALRRGPG